MKHTKHIKIPHYVIAAYIGASLGTYVPQAVALTLPEVLEAARNNWDVQQMRSNANAAQADVRAADRSPFPTLSIKFSSMDLQNGTGEGNWLTERRIDKGIGIDWTLERGNKRALRTQSAEHAAIAAQADAQEGEMQQRLMASNAFFDLAAAQERLQHVKAMADATMQIAATAARRMKAGDLARQDALRLEIEAERAKGDVLSAQLDLERAQLAVSAIIGAKEPASGWDISPNWMTTLPNLAEAVNDIREEDFIQNRADVRAASARVAAMQAALENASAQKKADVTVGMSLDHYPGTSTQLLELRMQMPLQFGYEYQGEIGRAQAQLDIAQQAFDKVRHAAILDLHTLHAQLQSAMQRSQRYEHAILPRAREVAAQAEFAYAKGALALNDLIDARRTLRSTGLEAVAAFADYAKAQTAWRLRTEKAEKGNL